MQKKIPIIVFSSSLAIVVLILFQLKWLQQSRDLLEEQFNQKVSLALCSAVDGLAKSGGCASLRKSCASDLTKSSCQDRTLALSQYPEFDQQLHASLALYQIDTPYELQIVKNTEAPSDESTLVYSFSLNPLLDSDSHLLNIQFPGRERYILEKMGFMISSSIIILLFVGGVFFLANRYLIRQKRLSQLNVAFFNHMAHEFRTPLTNIQLAGRLLQKKEASLADNRFLTIIHKESRQLQGQVDTVLNLARLDDQERRLQFESVQLASLLHKVIDEMQLQTQAYQGTIRLHRLSESVRCFGDPFHLHNVFRNLIDNALKYSGSKPEIAIRVQEREQDVLICLRDKGPGIAPKDQNRIFQRFFRLEDAGKKGFGLGLPYVKKVVELHQGQLRLISDLNAGATFEIYLPKLAR